jgi:hypothetical protein
LTTDADGLRYREPGPFIELELLSRIQQAFETTESKPDGFVKAVVEPAA